MIFSPFFTNTFDDFKELDPNGGFLGQRTGSPVTIVVSIPSHRSWYKEHISKKKLKYIDKYIIIFLPCSMIGKFLKYSWTLEPLVFYKGPFQLFRCASHHPLRSSWATTPQTWRGSHQRRRAALGVSTMRQGMPGKWWAMSAKSSGHVPVRHGSYGPSMAHRNR